MVDTQNIATPWHSNYETNSSCDPTEPLDAVYQWAYCDEETEKIVVLGNRSWDGGDEVEWEMRRCSVNSDCDNPKYLCVHISYGLRYCVLSHKFKPENSQLDSWTLTIGIISLFIGIIIVITWTPISVFQ
ncbi:hypothetical protein GCK72_006653 [Caenorhabditis remanei]|uniref:Domain of unknown function DX domain-containing protein n=1 Tax=Caenorhabditis remanei TaxID=31234 RepID=A0A6A5HGU9_CAERE|nr:hypothetical protein GCK72_006653 [Caenorhabditis remanei]KAF1766695.1 hypothetical protein GCK72_006653 [Caenorhabditis remanei]